MKRFVAAVAFLVAATATSGCGMVMNGLTHGVTVHATPAEAEVFLDGSRVTGVTEVANGRRHRVLVRAAGFEDAVVDFDPQTRAVPIVLDILFFIPSLTTTLVCDLLLGTFRRAPSDVEVVLTPATPAPPLVAPEYAPAIFVAGEHGATPAPVATDYGAADRPNAGDYLGETVDLSQYARVVAPPPAPEPVVAPEPPVADPAPHPHRRTGHRPASTR